jgi:hypothetical protein
VSVQSAHDIVKHAPSREAWRRLIHALEGLDPRAVAEIAPSLQETLATWPDRIRIRPRRWGLQVLRDRARLLDPPHPGWPLGTTLHLGTIADAGLCDALTSWSGTDGLAGLTLEGAAPGEGLSTLADAERMVGLRWLGLRHAQLKKAPSDWVNGRVVGELMRLDLANARVSTDTLEALAERPLRKLERLHLGGIAIADAVAVRMLKRAEWTRLTRLNLYGTVLTKRVANAFARNPSLTGVARITFGALPGDEAALDPDAVLALAPKERAPTLERVTIRGMKLSSDAAAALLRCVVPTGEIVVRDCTMPDRVRDTWRRGQVNGPNVRIR